MKWITREKVKVDRGACPGRIRRFIDPQAEFLFVPADQVEAKAREIGATPFDLQGCELGHHGEDVSFNSFLEEYSLTDPALLLPGESVRAADGHPSKPHPAGEGLRWVAFGFNALGLTDHAILQREFVRCCERLPYAFVILRAMDHGGVSARRFGPLVFVEMVTAMLCYIPGAHLADWRQLAQLPVQLGATSEGRWIPSTLRPARPGSRQQGRRRVLRRGRTVRASSTRRL